VTREFGVVVAIATASLTVGCGANSQQRAREYMPDMARDPAYKAFAPNPVTRDRLTLQSPVPGTIARGYLPVHYGPGEQEAARAGRELQNPYHASPQTLEQGKALYETYCSICHGRDGKGDGPIAEKIPHPPSYTSDRLLEFPSGRIFHVITMGAGKMPPYASQLRVDERWKIVTYVRTSLQGFEEGSDSDYHGGLP
jgi:mono/diheme cytochrome c family protein